MIAFALGTALLIAEVLLSSLVKGMITETGNYFALVERSYGREGVSTGREVMGESLTRLLQFGIISYYL